MVSILTFNAGVFGAVDIDAIIFQLGLLLSLVPVIFQLIYNTNHIILNSYQINNAILHTGLMVKNSDHSQIWYIFRQ